MLKSKCLKKLRSNCWRSKYFFRDKFNRKSFLAAWQVWIFVMEEWIGIGNRSYSQFQAWLDLELLSFQIEFPKLYFWKALHCVLYTFYGRILRAGRTAQPRTSLRPGQRGTGFSSARRTLASLSLVAPLPGNRWCKDTIPPITILYGAAIAWRYKLSLPKYTDKGLRWSNPERMF